MSFGTVTQNGKDGLNVPMCFQETNDVELSAQNLNLPSLQTPNVFVVVIQGPSIPGYI